jgi:trans-aconitate 2-methyltransferase
MPTWDASQYLRFDAERSRPCRDLVDNIRIENPSRIIDLGCGPGNSTAILNARWPDAHLTGLDRSAEMIAAASASPIGSKAEWRVGDVSAWATPRQGSGQALRQGSGQALRQGSGQALRQGSGQALRQGSGQADEQFDLVFSNAALQWVPDHARLFPRLFSHVVPGGALAIQVPMNLDAPAHRIMRELAASSAWVGKFPAGGVRQWHAHSAAFYYDLLASLVNPPAAMDIWQTEYIHILSGPEEIVEWYKGTGLRPFLDALGQRDGRDAPTAEADRAAFIGDYFELIRDAFPRYSDGRVLFPFQRLFLIAYASAS